MTWFKIDDKFSFNEKVLGAGNQAIGAWSRAGSWSSERGTDGVVPWSVALTIDQREVWDKLIEVGLCDLSDDGQELTIHNFLRYNPSASKVAKTRKSRAKAGALGGKQKASNALANASQVAGNDLANQKHAPGNDITKSWPPDPDPDPDPKSEIPPPPCAASDAKAPDGRVAREGPPVREASPEVPAAKPSDSSGSRENPYDLARRVWGELWTERYGKRFVWSPSLGDAQHRKAQQLGHMAVEAAGDGAEHWLRHKVRCYLADPGDKKLDLGARQHPFPLFVARVNEYPDPKPKAPERLQDAPTLAASLPHNPHAAERAAALLASLPGGNLMTESPDARERREHERALRLAHKASLEAQMPTRGAA